MSPQTELVLNILKIFGLSAFAFFFAVSWTPLLTHFLYKHRMWRKNVRQIAPDGAGTPLFAELHKDREVSTPRMGGLLIWVTALIITYVLWALARFTSNPFFDKINFLSRNQTWLPLFTLASASILGLADDLAQIF